MIGSRLPAPIVPEFTPVPRRKPQQSGWTAARQRDFIAALAATGSVTTAVDAVGMSSKSAYLLRAADGAASFRAAWAAALDCGVAALRSLAYDRAVNGVPVHLQWQGQVTGETVKYDNRLLVSVLRQYERPRGGDAAERAAAAQVEPEDAATRLWHNSILELEDASVRRRFYSLYVGLIRLGASKGRSILEEADSCKYMLEILEEKVERLQQNVAAGPAGCAAAARTIKDKIRWTPLSEAQRVVAARVEARLAGLPFVEPPPPPDFPRQIPAPLDVMERVLAEVLPTG